MALEDLTKAQLIEKINARRNGNGKDGMIKRLRPVDSKGLKATTAMEEYLLLRALWQKHHDNVTPLTTLQKARKDKNRALELYGNAAREYEDNVASSWYLHAANLGLGYLFKGKNIGPISFR